MIANHVQVMAMLIPSFMLVFFMDRWRIHGRHFRRRCFLTRHLLRSPGESSRIQLDEMTSRISAYLALTVTIPLVIYSASLLVRNEPGADGTLALAIDALAVAACMIYALWGLHSLIKEKRRLATELETKMAVAQELNGLMYEGYKVFHDLPADGFNIDHVVVGRTGVYALATRGLTTSAAKFDASDWDVVYDGHSLRFPGWQETEAIEQASFQAAWLQKWLVEAGGNDVPVYPVLVLPGWYINQEAEGGIRVSNGKNIRSLLLHHEPDHLPLFHQAFRRIADQLDQRCRHGAVAARQPFITDWEDDMDPASPDTNFANVFPICNFSTAAWPMRAGERPRCGGHHGDHRTSARSEGGAEAPVKAGAWPWHLLQARRRRALPRTRY